MNDQYYMCCEECFENLGKRNGAAACLWLDLCALESKFGIGSLICDENPLLRLMEMQGYIVTTDILKNILIKIKGRMEIEDGHLYFCSKEGFHE